MISMKYRSLEQDASATLSTGAQDVWDEQDFVIGKSFDKTKMLCHTIS